MQICYHSFYSSPIQQENLILKYVGLIHFQLDMNSVTENLKNFMVEGSDHVYFRYPRSTHRSIHRSICRSSLGRDSRSIVGRYVGRLPTDYRPTIDRLSIETRPRLDRHIDRCIDRCVDRGYLNGSIESRTLLFQVMDKDLFSARLVLFNIVSRGDWL